MDAVVFIALLIAMCLASCRVSLVWSNRTTAFDAWPEEMLRAAPTVVWLGTAFFASGTILVLGPFSDGHPVALVAALITFVSGIGVVIFGITLSASGRPQRFVPPHLRDGAARGRRARRRSARL
jgi:hypothetical protein